MLDRPWVPAQRLSTTPSGLNDAMGLLLPAAKVAPTRPAYVTVLFDSLNWKPTPAWLSLHRVTYIGCRPSRSGDTDRIDSRNLVDCTPSWGGPRPTMKDKREHRQPNMCGGCPLAQVLTVALRLDGLPVLANLGRYDSMLECPSKLTSGAAFILPPAALVASRGSTTLSHGCVPACKRWPGNKPASLVRAVRPRL